LQLRFDLSDENSLRANTLIGSAIISVAALMDNFGIPQDFAFNVVDTKGKITGDIIVSLVVK
jgi:hypothetical protein